MSASVQNYDPSRPLRAGVFSTAQAAHAAVERLRAAGFAAEQITVVCSDEAKEREFREFEHEQPAGSHTPAAAAAGGTVGAAVGAIAAGAAAGAAGVITGFPLIAGGAGLLTGGVVGGFLGAMLTRGLEKESANFYDQAVAEGKLLVTVEAHGERAAKELAQAEQILNAAGAEPLPLESG